MSAALTRDDWVAVVAGAVGLLLLGRSAAGNATAAAWTAWGGAALMFAVLVPAVAGHLRELVAADPVWRFIIPAFVLAAGLSGAIVAGDVPTARLVAWPVAVAAAVVVAGTGPKEPAAWQLLACAVLIGAAAAAWDRSLRLAVPSGPRIGFTFFSAVALAAFLFNSARPLPTFNLRLALSRKDIVAALIGVAAIVVVALPLGAVAGFVVWEPRLGSLDAAVLRLLSYAVFIGLPEEMLFRGLIQEGLGRRFGAGRGWIAASVLFGLAHIGRETGLTELQRTELAGLNWRLALLATTAGLGYGWVYRTTGRLAAAALTHGIVNWLWSGLFLRG
ncbi:MAG TPA: CPBP family intramembrane glutamic endopeptidase [Gemmatimonadales bacterium]|nr:CPBP family intramembrane glutamic endopeptidase [Gemmatimonadales bacterium]